MNKQKLLLISILAISIFIQSCTKKASSDKIISNYDFEYILMANDSNSKMLSIYNNADTIIDITFQLNNHFWFSKQQMISDINNLKPDTIQNMETPINKVVSFINQFSRHSNPLNIDDRILYNPFIMFNSIGSGFCNHRSAVSNLIWNEMGLKTRLIHLDGHAVSEVFTKSKWQVIDVDNGIYFSDTANTILSLNEIIKNKDKINIKYIKESTSISLIYMLLNREYFLNLFTSFENNNLDKSGFENISWDSTFLTLPQNPNLSFLSTIKDIKPIFNIRFAD